MTSIKILVQFQMDERTRLVSELGIFTAEDLEKRLLQRIRQYASILAEVYTTESAPAVTTLVEGK